MSNIRLRWVAISIVIVPIITLGGCGGAGVSPTQIISTSSARPSITLLSITRTPVVFPSRTPTPNDGAAHIAIGDNYFDPTITTIKAGMVVEWWHSGNGTHSITSLESKWSSIFPTFGGRYRLSFDIPGVYNYVCAFHSGMGGTIKVID